MPGWGGELVGPKIGWVGGRGGGRMVATVYRGSCAERAQYADRAKYADRGMR